MGKFAYCIGSYEGVVRKEAASVVVTSRFWASKEGATSDGFGKGGWSGAVVGRLIGERDVAIIAIDPEILTPEILGDFDGDEGGPLFDLGYVLGSGRVF